MKRRTRLLFIGAEAALYAAFLWLDATGGGSTLVKYAAIILCFLFAAASACRGGSKRIALALALTLAADTFLLLLDSEYAVGVLFFCGVQAVYLTVILRENGGSSLWGLRLTLFAASVVLLWALDLLLPLNVLVLFYFSNFAVNVIQSFAGKLPPIFCFGLLLFLFCDICVGIDNAPELFPAAIRNPVNYMIWVFYLPGQVLLTLSGTLKERKEAEP